MGDVERVISPNVTSEGQIRNSVRSFIIDHFLFGEERDMELSASLLDGGILDSTGVVELVAFIEGEYGITVADTEMVTENFDSIENISRFVFSKLAAQEVGASVIRLSS